MSISKPRDAIEDIVRKLRKSFKDMTLQTRRKAWKSVRSDHGEKQVQKLIVNPDRQLQPLIMSFKEWINEA
jgi:hypothetical protein